MTHSFDSYPDDTSPVASFWEAAAKLDVLAHTYGDVDVHHPAEIIRIGYCDTIGVVEATFDYYKNGGSFLPRLEKKIETWNGSVRELHVLDSDEATTSLMPDGNTKIGGIEEIAMMAAGIKDIIRRITANPLDPMWRIRLKDITD